MLLLLKQCFAFRTLLTCLVDGSRRSSSGRGFLELPSNNNVLRQGLFWYSLSGSAERIWKNTCRTTVLEPGSSIFIFICPVCCSNLSSGWRGWWELLGIWKSWCKMTHYTNVLLLIIISLPDRQTLWIQGIFFSASLFACDNKYISYRMFWVWHRRRLTGSSLIRSLSRLRSTCSLSYGRHSWLYRSWNLVFRLFEQFPSFNKHWPNFPASFPLSYLLWCSTLQMLLVSLMRKIVLIIFTFSKINTRTATGMRNKSGQMAS